MVKFLASGAPTHACCVGGDLKHLDAHFDLAERTGLECAKSQRTVENREKWRKLVVKSSVVPQQPLWLRER